MIRLTLKPEPAERHEQTIFGGIVTTGGGVLNTNTQALRINGSIEVPPSGDLVGDAGDWARAVLLKAGGGEARVEIRRTVEVVIGIARLGPSQPEGSRKARAVEVEWMGAGAGAGGRKS